MCITNASSVVCLAPEWIVGPLWEAKSTSTFKNFLRCSELRGENVYEPEIVCLIHRIINDRTEK